MQKHSEWKGYKHAGCSVTSQEVECGNEALTILSQFCIVERRCATKIEVLPAASSCSPRHSSVGVHRISRITTRDTCHITLMHNLAYLQEQTTLSSRMRGSAALCGPPYVCTPLCKGWRQTSPRHERPFDASQGPTWTYPASMNGRCAKVQNDHNL